MRRCVWKLYLNHQPIREQNHKNIHGKCESFTWSDSNFTITFFYLYHFRFSIKLLQFPSIKLECSPHIFLGLHRRVCVVLWKFLETQPNNRISSLSGGGTCTNQPVPSVPMRSKFRVPTTECRRNLLMPSELYWSSAKLPTWMYHGLRLSNNVGLHLW